MICIIVNLINLVAPIEQTTPALLEKDAKYIDIRILSFSFANSIVWTLFGVAADDIYIAIPNFMGVIT